MHPSKPLFSKVLMSVLTAGMASVSVLGNGFFLAVIARFKSLRTVPNILAANLAVVDLLDAIVNVPSYMAYTVLEVSWYRGRALAFTACILNRLFLLLDLVSMLVMMINTYLGISFDLRYFNWQTNKKALVCVGLIWFLSLVAVMLLSIPIFQIDLGDTHVIVYRAEIYERGRYFVAGVMGLFIICGVIVSFRTIRAIREKEKQRAELNLPPVRAAARLREDISAIKTIAITIAVYIVSYVPAIVYAMAGLQKETLADSWFAFIAWYSVNISNAVNPIIYYFRSSRRRSAFKQFLEDPFGSSDFKEKYSGKRRNALVTGDEEAGTIAKAAWALGGAGEKVQVVKQAWGAETEARVGEEAGAGKEAGKEAGTGDKESGEGGQHGRAGRKVKAGVADFEEVSCESRVIDQEGRRVEEAGADVGAAAGESDVGDEEGRRGREMVAGGADAGAGVAGPGEAGAGAEEERRVEEAGAGGAGQGEAGAGDKKGKAVEEMGAGVEGPGEEGAGAEEERGVEETGAGGAGARARDKEGRGVEEMGAGEEGLRGEAGAGADEERGVEETGAGGAGAREGDKEGRGVEEVGTGEEGLRGEAGAGVEEGRGVEEVGTGEEGLGEAGAESKAGMEQETKKNEGQEEK